MKALKYVLMLTLVSAIACSDQGPGKITQPERSSFEGSFTITKTQEPGDLPPSTCGDEFEAVRFSGSGSASGLGPSTIELSHCLDLGSVSEDGKSYEIIMGWLEVTNDQGNGFRARYSGTYRPAARDTLSGAFYIITGTGQFQDRADSGGFRAVGTRSPNEFTLQLQAEK